MFHTSSDTLLTTAARAQEMESVGLYLIYYKSFENYCEAIGKDFSSGWIFRWLFTFPTERATQGARHRKHQLSSAWFALNWLVTTVRSPVPRSETGAVSCKPYQNHISN